MASVDIQGSSVKLSVPSELGHGAVDTASIALQGATVYSYVKSDLERLFLSSKSGIDGPQAVRGGIPICWPLFGPPPSADHPKLGKMKQHGFARSSKWQLVDHGTESDFVGARAVFQLTPNDEIKKVYRPDFVLTYSVTLTPTSLTCHLTVKAPYVEPVHVEDRVDFQALLHTYLRLPAGTSPSRTTVRPLDGVKFTDKVHGGQVGRESRERVHFDGPGGEIDRVYHGASDNLTVAWDEQVTSGTCELTKAGFPDVVTWNCGKAKASTMADMEDGGEEHYICVEPGMCSDFVHLKENSSWDASMRLAFHD